ncbi:uncharacterized protein [Miscanthus floridulus]|uniref:uncharacterized protein n=1 Tax=Miscanthus floridulus TaxID=154761 RepID=UPI00345A0211
MAHHVKARTSRTGFSLSQAPTPPRAQLLLLRLLRSVVVATQRHRRLNPLVRATLPWPGGFVVATHLLAPNSSSAAALFPTPLAAALVPDTAREGKAVPCCYARLLVHSPASAPPPPLNEVHATPGAPSALEANVAAPPPCAPLLPRAPAAAAAKRRADVPRPCTCAPCPRRSIRCVAHTAQPPWPATITVPASARAGPLPQRATRPRCRAPWSCAAAAAAVMGTPPVGPSWAIVTVSAGRHVSPGALL